MGFDSGKAFCKPRGMKPRVHSRENSPQGMYPGKSRNASPRDRYVLYYTLLCYTVLNYTALYCIAVDCTSFHLFNSPCSRSPHTTYSVSIKMMSRLILALYIPLAVHSDITKTLSDLSSAALIFFMDDALRIDRSIGSSCSSSSLKKRKRREWRRGQRAF